MTPTKKVAPDPRYLAKTLSHWNRFIFSYMKPIWPDSEALRPLQQQLVSQVELRLKLGSALTHFSNIAAPFSVWPVKRDIHDRYFQNEGFFCFFLKRSAARNCMPLNVAAYITIEPLLTAIWSSRFGIYRYAQDYISGFVAVIKVLYFPTRALH